MDVGDGGCNKLCYLHVMCLCQCPNTPPPPTHSKLNAYLLRPRDIPYLEP